MRSFKTAPIVSIGQAYYADNDSIVITHVDLGCVKYSGIDHTTAATFHGRAHIDEFLFTVKPYLAEDLLSLDEDITKFLIEQANINFLLEGFVVTDDMIEIEELPPEDGDIILDQDGDTHLHTFVDEDEDEDEDEDLFFPQVDRGVYATMLEDDMF